MDVRAQLQTEGLLQAGVLRPAASGGCEYAVKPDVTGFIVYAHVVGEVVKKFGTTTPSLRSRVAQNASTINQMIVLLEGRAPRDARWHHRPFDAFKRLAPEAIKAGQTIEVWAIQSTEGEYKALERHLNAKYSTIANGWAIRLG
jgi:hypothetical protein